MASKAHDSYIVDGYNVLHALFADLRQEELEDRRRWLAEQLAGFAALRDARVVLVFDAHTQPRGTCEPLAGTRVEICYAGGSRSADEVIARRIATEPADAAIVVVSADYEVQRTATRAGVRRMTPRELGAAMGVDHKLLANDENTSRMATTLEDKVDLETWRKLERLRREGG
jgi:predicted RNA-binding protein with PIN domain